MPTPVSDTETTSLLPSALAETVIRPPEGRCDEFMRKRLEFGNHLQWIYGDYAEHMRTVGTLLGLQVEVIA